MNHSNKTMIISVGKIDEGVEVENKVFGNTLYLKRCNHSNTTFPFLNTLLNENPGLCNFCFFSP